MEDDKNEWIEQWRNWRIRKEFWKQKNDWNKGKGTSSENIKKKVNRNKVKEVEKDAAWQMG